MLTDESSFLIFQTHAWSSDTNHNARVNPANDLFSTSYWVQHYWEYRYYYIKILLNCNFIITKKVMAMKWTVISNFNSEFALHLYLTQATK